MASIPVGHTDILEKKALAVVATVGPKDAPQTSVVWFDWDGSALRFSTTKQRAKFKHLQKNTSVSVFILDPDDDHRYLELRGEARVSDDPDGSLIDRLSVRYNGSAWEGPIVGRVIVSLEPTKVVAYGE